MPACEAVVLRADEGGLIFEGTFCCLKIEVVSGERLGEASLRLIGSIIATSMHSIVNCK